MIITLVLRIEILFDKILMMFDKKYRIHPFGATTYITHMYSFMDNMRDAMTQTKYFSDLR